MHIRYHPKSMSPPAQVNHVHRELVAKMPNTAHSISISAAFKVCSLLDLLLASGLPSDSGCWKLKPGSKLTFAVLATCRAWPKPHCSGPSGWLASSAPAQERQALRSQLPCFWEDLRWQRFQNLWRSEMTKVNHTTVCHCLLSRHWAAVKCASQRVCTTV